MSPSTAPQPDFQQVINRILNNYPAGSKALIMAMQDVQTNFKYLPKDALILLARGMQLPIAQIYSVATFYKAFSLKPKGRHHICVCTGTACHVRRSKIIVDNLGLALGIKPTETTADGEISFETVNCLGACAMGPLVTVDGEFHGNMDVRRMNRILDQLRGRASETEPDEVSDENL